MGEDSLAFLIVGREERSRAAFWYVWTRITGLLGFYHDFLVDFVFCSRVAWNECTQGKVRGHCCRRCKKNEAIGIVAGNECEKMIRARTASIYSITLTWKDRYFLRHVLNFTFDSRTQTRAGSQDLSSESAQRCLSRKQTRARV